MQFPTGLLGTEIGGAVTAGAVTPATVLEAPVLVRASVTFVLVGLVGAVLLTRRGRFVASTRDAALAQPLSSVGYGVSAHAVFGFAAAYLASQLALVDIGGIEFGSVGLVVGGVLVVLSGSLGFTVVGIAVADVWGTASDLPGVALGALLAACVASIEPLYAGVAWVVLVSFGIGGAVREWLHASARQDI